MSEVKPYDKHGHEIEAHKWLAAYGHQPLFIDYIVDHGDELELYYFNGSYAWKPELAENFLVITFWPTVKCNGCKTLYNQMKYYENRVYGFDCSCGHKARFEDKSEARAIMNYNNRLNADK